METATLPDEVEDAPVDEAEATRSTAHLFQYSAYVDAGADAEDCEHARDGHCKDAEHFHAWVCMPNSLQHRDVLAKAAAAKARRKRAMRDAGGDGRPASDAYVTLESGLDDAFEGDIELLVEEMANRQVRKRMSAIVREALESEDRFANYHQDAEEWRRMVAIPEDERPTEEFEALDRLMTEFESAVKMLVESETDRDRDVLRGLDAERLRGVVRKARVETESNEAHLATYYTWLGFIGTRKCATKQGVSSKRYFQSVNEFIEASPEVVEAIDDALRDLEMRLNRGDASGN